MSSKLALNILIVDDEPLIRKSLCELLKLKGYIVTTAANAEDALKIIHNHHVDVVITDLNLPGADGLELLKKIKIFNKAIEVVLITGYGKIETAVRAMKLNAFDYITKPIIDDEIMIIIDKIIERRIIVDENIALKKIINSVHRSSFHGMIGASQVMQNVYALIESVASTNATIMISGESGTGKGVVAKTIHKCDKRRCEMPFVEISCGALSETLLESELFGHSKGAFTGAIKEKKGRFEIANGGTIFLDEIDTCSPNLQVKLLRILQDGCFERVGETLTRKTDARIIVATNQNLSALVSKGAFREDLYYRIHVIPIALSPLRERKEDIPLLIDGFIKDFNLKNSRKIKNVSDEVLKLLISYSWPGNIRQLENVLEGACILAKEDYINLGDLPKTFNFNENSEFKSSSAISLKDELKEPEKKIIVKALNDMNGNKSLVAKKLGINRATLYNKLRKYNINFPTPS